MKSSFKSFLPPLPSELKSAWTSGKTVFIFDTNVLLNLYGFEDQTRKDFFSTVEKLEGKIFLPHHVGLEYNLQRLHVIRNEKKTFRELAAITTRLEEKLKKDLDQLKLKEKFPEVSNLADQFRADILNAVKKFTTGIEPWNKNQPDVRSEDRILDKIHDLTDGRIGPPPPDQEWLDELYKEGTNRYANLIPPGFRDIDKDSSEKRPPKFMYNERSYERKYGDLIIWKQILEHANSTDIHNVFFITDDAKDDWWSIIDSGGNKTIGPHEALRTEIYKTGKVKLFHMYSTSDFMENGRNILKVDIQQSSINDAIAKHIEHSLTRKPEVNRALAHASRLARQIELIELTKKSQAERAYFRDINKVIRAERYKHFAQNNETIKDLYKIKTSENGELSSSDLLAEISELERLQMQHYAEVIKERINIDSLDNYIGQVVPDDLDDVLDPDDEGVIEH